MAYGDFRNHSKTGWTGESSLEAINVGSLQRIADATEKMASNYTFLQNERDKYERWYKQERASNERMARRISALQGVITRMKKAKKEGK